MGGTCPHQLDSLDCYTSKVIFYVVGSVFGFGALVAWFFVGLRLLHLFDRLLTPPAPLAVAPPPPPLAVAPPPPPLAVVESGEFSGVELRMMADYGGDSDDEADGEGFELGALLHPLGVSVPVREAVRIPIVHEGVVVAQVDLLDSPTTSGAA